MLQVVQILQDLLHAEDVCGYIALSDCSVGSPADHWVWSQAAVSPSTTLSNEYVSCRLKLTYLIEKLNFNS
jgi:hypothetical protein